MDYDDYESIIFSIIAFVITVIGSLIGFKNTSKLSKDFKPSNIISFEVIEKSKKNNYLSVISFKLKNNSDILVNRIEGQMIFYNGNNEISYWTVSFTGNYEPGCTYNTTVQFNESSPVIYDIPFNNLGITYKITNMQVRNNFDDHKVNDDPLILKTATYSFVY